MPWVYILRCATGDLYVGITSDLQQRLKRHNEGTACGHTQHRRPVTLAYSEEVLTWLDAAARERQIKRWTRAKKEALVSHALAGLTPRRVGSVHSDDASDSYIKGRWVLTHVE